MKVAIVTWITYNNYGTELQAFALQKFLEMSGYFNLIISDEKIVEKKRKILSCCRNYPSNKKTKKNTFFKKINDYYKYNYVFKYYYLSQKRIDEFKQKDLMIYYPSNINSLDSEFDVFLCGSDQIWSPLDDNFDEYYFLNYYKKSKIAYAPSFGLSYIPKDKECKIISFLSDFYAISLRENTLIDKLSSLLRKKIEWVVDPTLLFDSLFWNNFCVGVNQYCGRYILCYFLEDNPWYFAYATDMAKKMKLKLLIIPNLKSHVKRKGCLRKAVGPKEFVNLFREATFVLTDSYHGSIFSIIFEKQFLCFKRFSNADPYNQNSRIFSLFEYLNILNCIIENKNFSSEDLITINYSIVNERIIKIRNRSIQFLRSNLLNILNNR